MVKFRIREEKYESGKSKFFPQIFLDNYWKHLPYNSFATIEEAQKLIENHRMIMYGVDELVEEKIHKVNLDLYGKFKQQR